MRKLVLSLALMLAALPALAHSHNEGVAKVTDGGSRPDPTFKGVKIGGDFNLLNQEGRRVTNHTYHGYYQLVYFGFTFCPDICPTDLQNAVEAIKLLGKDASKFKLLFITLDPERDRPKVIADYLKMFNSNITGLTGTKEEIADVAKAYRMHYKKVGSGADYEIEHISAFYLLGPDGNYRTMFGSDSSAEELAEKLKKELN